LSNSTIDSLLDKFKLFVLEKIFREKKFFNPKRKTNLNNTLMNNFKFVLDNHFTGEEWGIYLDKNGWLFNPVNGFLVFYIDDKNIYKFSLEEVKSLSTLPFYKGGMFSSPGIKLNVNGFKDGLHIGIKSKFFKETQETYRTWVKFLFVLNNLKRNVLEKEKNNLKVQNHELLESLKNYSDSLLLNYLSDVREILDLKKEEIELKEKEFNSNFIHDMIKILNFIKSNIDSFRSNTLSIRITLERKIENNDFLSSRDIKKLISSEDKFVSFNSTIIFGLIEMIRSIINNDRVRFYEIYEKFDKVRIFNSQYQNDVINSLSSINKNLVDISTKIDNLINTIEIMGDQILSSIDELKFEVSYLNDNISGQLQSISSKLDVNNLLNMVQTYQLYRINSNTKSLRS